jgi:hypothetical protein
MVVPWERETVADEPFFTCECFCNERRYWRLLPLNAHVMFSKWPIHGICIYLSISRKSGSIRSLVGRFGDLH